MLILEPCKIPILLGSCRYLVLICRIHGVVVTKAVMETSRLFGEFFDKKQLFALRNRSYKEHFWKWDKGGDVPPLKDCGPCLNILEVRYWIFNWLRIAVKFSGIFSTKSIQRTPIKSQPSLSTLFCFNLHPLSRISAGDVLYPEAKNSFQKIWYLVTKANLSILYLNTHPISRNFMEFFFLVDWVEGTSLWWGKGNFKPSDRMDVGSWGA